MWANITSSTAASHTLLTHNYLIKLKNLLQLSYAINVSFYQEIKKRLRQGRGWSWDYRWGYCLLTCQVLQTSATFDIRRMGSNTKTSFRCTWVDKSYWAKADGDLTAKMSMLVTDYKCDPSRNKKKVWARECWRTDMTAVQDSCRNRCTQEQRDTYLRTGICGLLVSAKSFLSLWNTCLYRVYCELKGKDKMVINNIVVNKQDKSLWLLSFVGNESDARWKHDLDILFHCECKSWIYASCACGKWQGCIRWKGYKLEIGMFDKYHHHWMWEDSDHQC